MHGLRVKIRNGSASALNGAFCQSDLPHNLVWPKKSQAMGSWVRPTLRTDPLTPGKILQLLLGIASAGSRP